MKNIFEVSNEEKSRILSLHENATKKQYLLSEQQPIRVEYDIDGMTLVGVFQDEELFVTFPNTGVQELMPSNEELTTGNVKVTDYPQLIAFNEDIHRNALQKLYDTDPDNPPTDEERQNDLKEKMRNKFHVPTYQMMPQFEPVGVICTVDNSRNVKADPYEETTPGRIV